ncbi:hypothetical protein BY458DRAFT_527378 [Sporodiniella umbellata]|nr:hypothetical protein BY458DRAFT_527378 [Sporodiniella umbellata]
MDTSERWRNRKTSTTQRNVDKELLKIKSLGVVSVLNKTFEDEPHGRSRSTSYSSEEQQRELESLRIDNEQKKDLLGLQDALIDHLSAQIDYLSEQSTQTQPELGPMRQDLSNLGSQGEAYRQEIERVQQRLTLSEARLETVERSARQREQQHAEAQEAANEKIEMLSQQLKEKEDMVSKLSMSLSRSSTFSEKNEEDDRSSLRSSTSSRHRRSYIARWKGNSLPPASPPPSTPLPPVPSDRRRSSASRLPVISNKHMSVDAVGGTQPFSSMYEQEVYYKEFTDQLQQRLSVSKEIDHLSVWKPTDYDDIQRKIESEEWLEDQQKVAFWKGMKKKLKV